MLLAQEIPLCVQEVMESSDFLEFYTVVIKYNMIPRIGIQAIKFTDE